MKEGAHNWMGTKKTRLMRGDRYGLLKAAELAAELIGEYERARDGAITIRVECPDSEAWDDIVVEHRGRTDLWQVRRLKVELARPAAEQLLASTIGRPATRRLFGVAAFVPITAGSKTICNLRDLADLCEEARTPGTDAALFAKREAQSPAFKLFSSSLPAGTPDGTVVTALQSLHVEELGLEAQLRDRARGHLHDIFTNSDEVVEKLFTWFLKTPDGTVVVDVGLLYNTIVDPVGRRDPARPRWIHLSRDPVSAKWESRGPLAHQDLVGVAWSAGAGRVLLGVPPHAGDAVSGALSRLALHRVAGVSLEAATSDAQRWKEHSTTACGSTLGKTAEPLCLTCDPLATTPLSRPRDETDIPAFAAMLSDGMDAQVWSDYVKCVNSHLLEDEFGEDLRPTIRAVWMDWHACLEAGASRRATFLRSMLATVEEWGRKGFDASARVGPLIIDELARATVVALVIAAAFEGGGVRVEVGAAGSINNLRVGPVEAHVMALATASHPDDRKPWRLSNAPGPMLSAEEGIAILGVIEASAGDLFDVAFEDAVPFHASDSALQNFRSTGSPPPMVTASPKFVAARAKGVEAIKKHLSEVLGRMNDLRYASLRRALEGAPSDG